MKYLILLISCLALQAQEFIPYFGVPTGNGLLNNLTAMWEFEEIIPSNAQDSSVNNRDLTDNNSVAYSETGVVNHSREFGLGDDYFSRTSETAFTFGSSPFTIAGWIKIAQRELDVNDCTLIAKTDFSSTNGTAWWVQFDHNTGLDQFRFFYSTDGTFGSALDFELTDGLFTDTWYFVCVRWDGSTLHLSATIIDDATVATDVTVAFAGPFYDNSTVPVTVGAVTGDSNYDLEGNIDQLGVWSAYLSDCQVGKLFGARSGTFGYSQFDANTCE